MQIALIGKGRWAKNLQKYIHYFFDLKYQVDSKFNKSIIWKDREVKAVIIATPVQTHYEIAKEALLADKHVFVEKPLTLYSDEAEELKEISRERNLVLCTDYIFTFSDKLNRIKEDSKDRELVRVELTGHQFGKFRIEDVFWVLGSHYLSILSMFEDLESKKFVFLEHLIKDDKCISGFIMFKGGLINVNLLNPKKVGTCTFYFKDKIYSYNTQSEKDNLYNALREFKLMVQGYKQDNIDLSLTITKILETRTYDTIF